MNNQQLFEESENLLYSKSWFYSKRWNVPFEEVRSEAFEVFCEAVRRFDERRNVKFTTFLHHRLRALDEYYRRKRNQSERFKEIRFLDIIIKVRDRILERLAFYEAVKRLSRDGQEVVTGILQGDFHRPEMDRQRRVNKNRIRQRAVRDWNWDYKRVDRVWDELKGWWNENCEKIIA